jgi:hypothetical protein
MAKCSQIQLTQHAMNYAIRSGITITTGYALNQCSRLLKTVGKGRERDEIASLQLRLESKIRIISPAINMIELIAARGNTSLDSAVALTKSIRMEIQSLGVINLAITTSGVNMSSSLPSTVSPSRLLQASTFLSAGDSAYNMNPGSPAQIGPVFTLSLYMLFGGHAFRSDIKGAREMTWKEVIHKARVKLLRVPLDDLPGAEPTNRASNGAGFLTNSIPSDNLRNEYAYQLVIVEDLDDDRVHSFEDDLTPGPFGEVALAGIREFVPIHEICKIFYADTGKILNIGTEGEPNNPVLLLKRDQGAVPPRRMIDRQIIEEDEDPTPPATPYKNLDEEKDDNSEDEDDGNDPAAQIRRESSAVPESPMGHSTSNTLPWRFPRDLDPEWMALEVYVEEPDSDDEDPDQSADLFSPSRPASKRADSADPITNAMSSMHLQVATSLSSDPLKSSQIATVNPISSHFPMFKSTGPASVPALRSSLSLLELLIRLTALQQFQQTTHLSIEDELLNFFLSESSSTGAGADSERRKMTRATARRQVGFDPYAESPIKHRGEDYLHGHERYRSRNSNIYQDYNDFSSPAPATAGHFYTDVEDSPQGLHQSAGGSQALNSTGSRMSPSPSLRPEKLQGRQNSAPVTPVGPGRTRKEKLRNDRD